MERARRLGVALVLVATAVSGCTDLPDVAKACEAKEAAERAEGGRPVLQAASAYLDVVATFAWKDRAEGVCTEHAASALVIFTVRDPTGTTYGNTSCDPMGIQATADVAFGKTGDHTVPIRLSTVHDQNRTGWTGTVMVPLSEAYRNNERGAYDIRLWAKFPSKGTDADKVCAENAFVNVDLTATFRG
jgi:hypothetical protein